MCEITKAEFAALKEDVTELKGIYKTVNELALSTNELATEIKYMRRDQDTVQNRLAKLEDKPVKRYDALIGCLTSGIISAIISAVAVMIGLKR